MTLLSRTCVSPYQYSIKTMSLCHTVSEIFSVKEWHDLEAGGKGRSGTLKIAPFDTSYTTFYWSAIVSIALYMLYPFRVFLTLNNIVTLKSGLEVTQGHSNWYHLTACVRFPIRLP